MKKIIFLIFVFLFSSPAFAQVRDIDFCQKNICFKPELPGHAGLNLVGTSTLTYLIFDVYVAAFYANSDYNVTESPFDEDVSKYLVLEYLRDISKEDFIKKTKELLANDKSYSYRARDSDFEKVYNSFEDVKIGDRYSLSYDDLTGKTCLFLNKIEKLCIKSLDFSKAFFGIWLSESSVNERFTKELLGKY